MVKDHLEREVQAGAYVFYHGSLYVVVKVAHEHFAYLQYPSGGWLLKRPKRIWACDACLVDAATVKQFLSTTENYRYSSIQVDEAPT